MAYSFDIPSSKNKLRLMRKFVTDVLNSHDIPEIETNMMVLAVDEVCANIIIHGLQSNPLESVRLNINFAPDGVWFEIVDRGDGFDIINYNEPKIEDLIKKKNKGGIGIMLVKKIMDNIELKTTPQGNTLRLFKKIDS
ncbi:ATP-binding protein [Roseivirga sp.]|uniref:ATP-binding protein n=1 Tax=Roseivirga sp. TaxID=1964215 RepID=UPI003B5180D5